MADVYALVQEPAHYDEWYAQPVWLLIGIIALALILVLIARADRGNRSKPGSA
jgi:hypothetical protein